MSIKFHIETSDEFKKAFKKLAKLYEAGLGLSFFFVNGRWQVNLRTDKSHSYSVHIDKKFTKAVAKALDGMVYSGRVKANKPKKRKRLRARL